MKRTRKILGFMLLVFVIGVLRPDIELAYYLHPYIQTQDPYAILVYLWLLYATPVCLRLHWRSTFPPEVS